MVDAVIQRIETNYPQLLLGTDMPQDFIVWGYELGENKDLKETYLKLLESWEVVDRIFQKYFKNPEDFIGTQMHKRLLLAHFYGGDRDLFKVALPAMAHHRAAHGTAKEISLKNRGLTKAEFTQLLAEQGGRMPLHLIKIIEQGFVKRVPRNERLFEIYKDTLETVIKDDNMQVLLQHVEDLNQLENLLFHYANIRPETSRDYQLLITESYSSRPTACNTYLLAYFADFEANAVGNTQLNKQQCGALLGLGDLFRQELIKLREQYSYTEIADAYLYAKKAIEDNGKDRMREYMHTYLQCSPKHDVGTRVKAYASRVYNYLIGDTLHWARTNPKKATLLGVLFIAMTVMMFTFNPVERVLHLAGNNMDIHVPKWVKVVNGAAASVGARVIGARFARTGTGRVLMSMLPRSLLVSKVTWDGYVATAKVVKHTEPQAFKDKLDSLLVPAIKPPSPASNHLVLALSPQVRQGNRDEIASPLSPQVKYAAVEPFVRAIPGLSA